MGMPQVAGIRTMLLGEVTDAESGVASLEVEGAGFTTEGEKFLSMLYLQKGGGRQIVVTAKDRLGNENRCEIGLLLSLDGQTLTVSQRDWEGERSWDVEVDLQADRTYAYDKNGNLVQKSEDGQATVYEWDHENRLTRVIHPDGKETRYEYCRACSLGLLSRKTRKDGTVVEYSWDGANTVEERDSRDNSITEYFVMPQGMMGNVVSVTRHEATRHQKPVLSPHGCHGDGVADHRCRRGPRSRVETTMHQATSSPAFLTRNPPPKTLSPPLVGIPCRWTRIQGCGGRH